MGVRISNKLKVEIFNAEKAGFKDSTMDLSNFNEKFKGIEITQNDVLEALDLIIEFLIREDTNLLYLDIDKRNALLNIDNLKSKSISEIEQTLGCKCKIVPENTACTFGCYLKKGEEIQLGGTR